MTKRIIPFIALFLILTGLVYAQDNLPVRAPDSLPGTTPEMLNPDYWIARIADSDRVVMTLGQIRMLNEKNAARVIPADHPYTRSIRRIEADGPLFNVRDPLAIGETVPGSVVTDKLAVWEKRLMSTKLYDFWELPLTDDYKQGILANAAAEAVPGNVTPRFGMIVGHTTARLYPETKPGYRSRGYLDDHSITSLDIGMPVAVLHASLDGDYLFVLAPIAWGWVPAADIAFGSADAIRAYRAKESFVVATTHRTPYYQDSLFSVHAGYLYLGERLTLENSSSHGRRVLVPVREFDGSLAFKPGWIKPGADVSEGFLPYTQSNVITTAFSILHRPYGWHDSWGERDCGGIMRVIFNCFGFSLPRYWSFEQLCSDRATFVGDIKEEAEKNRTLATMPEGLTFTGTTGHIGLYLGTVDGKPYAIHQCGWNYKLDDGEYKMARVVVSDYENIGFNMRSLQFFTPMAP